MKREFSVGQMAKILNVARTTVINWINDGKLKAFQLPGGNNRVTRENLIKFMNEYGIPLSLLEEEYSGKTRVLIVDDEKDVHDILKEGLMREGMYEVKTTSTGFETGVLVKQFRPHVVVLDIKLKDIDGREVCEYIRKDPELSETKIIAISGRISDQKAKELTKQGFDVYLKKPFDIDTLHNTIKKL